MSTEQTELPPLPEPHAFILAANITWTQDRATALAQWALVGHQGSFIEQYTAEQMRKYGLVCALAVAPQGEITAADVAWATEQISKRLAQNPEAAGVAPCHDDKASGTE